MNDSIDISFAIPLYNKRNHILSVIESIFHACNNSGFNFEIIISENSSTDLEASLENIVERKDWLEKIRIFHLPKTISCGENWALALGLCTGKIIKLQLADDRLCGINVGNLISIFNEDPRIDYVIGKTRPIIESLNTSDSFTLQTAEYFNKVNQIRKQVVTCSNQQERISILFEHGFFSGSNVLGDINCLFIRRDCLSKILLPQHLGYSPSTWMDWEMLLASVVLREGTYWDDFVTEYSFNDSTNAVMSSSGSLTRMLQFEIPTTRAQFAYLIDPAFKEYIYPLLNSKQREQLALDATSLLINTNKCVLPSIVRHNKKRALKAILTVLFERLWH